MKKYFLIILLSCIYISSISAQQTYELVVNARKPGAEIQPTMYGLFFEDINFGADGGLYAELVKNRSFEFPQSLMGWNSFGKVEVRNDGAPFERNPHYVRLNNAGHGHKHTGLENEGFCGIGVKKDATYRFSVWARSGSAAGQKIRIELIDANNDPFERKELAIDSKEWKKYEIVLTSPKEEPKASLRIFLTSEGPVDLEHISFFPPIHGKAGRMVCAGIWWKRSMNSIPVCSVSRWMYRGGTDLETCYDWKKSSDRWKTVR